MGQTAAPRIKAMAGGHSHDAQNHQLIGGPRGDHELIQQKGRLWPSEHPTVWEKLLE